MNYLNIVINNLINVKTMMKSSNLIERKRELMDGENQCVSLDEWTSEFPNRTVIVVGFGELISSLSENYMKLSKASCNKVSCIYAANKGGTTVPRPLSDEGFFVFIKDTVEEISIK